MVKAVTVLPAQHRNDTPRSTAIIRQRDFGFMLSHPLKPGRHTIKVHNDGTQPHEVVLVKLKPGARGFFTSDFEPGRYGMICFFTDMPSRALHYHKGMTLDFTVE